MEENWTEKASQRSQEDLGRRRDAKETIRYWLVGFLSMSSVPIGGGHRKAQAAPLSRMARNQAGNSGGLQKVGAKGEIVEVCVEVVKRYRRASSQ